MPFTQSEIALTQSREIIRDLQKKEIQASPQRKAPNLKNQVQKSARRPVATSHVRPSSEAFQNRYRYIHNYIPEEGDKTKIININFNIFQDEHGAGNFSPFTNAADSLRLVTMLAWVNEIYATQPQCPGSSTYNSDPPPGIEVNDLSHKYIQFHLNGIYVYRDSYPGEGLWRSNNYRELLNRINDTDSSRLNQLNICFTEGHYLGSLRDIRIEETGRHYAHPLVRIKGGGGKGAEAFAKVKNGKLVNITLVNRGSHYTHPPEVIIEGGNGYGAKAEAILDEEKGQVARIDIINSGRNYNYTSISLKGGDGRGAIAYVKDIRRGRIRDIGIFRRGNRYSYTPEVIVETDSEGKGAVLSAYVRGATGFTTLPDFRDRDLYIVQKSLWNEGISAGDYAAATNIAHELGHILGLMHTYLGGNETNDENHPDYLWDVFGIPFSGFHIIDWGRDPCLSPKDRVTNNLMGGNQVSKYASPLQIGKMHRALHIYNVRKYASCSCQKDKFLIVENDEAWDFDMKLYNSLRIKNESTLTLKGKLEMPDGCTIIVEEGASLIIDTQGTLTGGCNKEWNGYLIIEKNAHFKLMPGGTFFLEDLSKFIIE